MNRHLIHGFAISTDLDLGNPVSVELSGQPVEAFELGPLDHALDPAIEPLLKIWSGPHQQARLFDLGTHFRLRIGDSLEADISSDITSLSIRRRADVSDELLGIFMVGMISATMIALRGDIAMHASGVLFGDRLVLFAGASGQGKSTMAAMGILAGGRLFADDVVRLARTDGTVVAHRGSMQLRIRSSASIDLAQFDEISRSTVDGRVAITPGAASPPSAQPFAIVIPLPDREITDARAERLPDEEAFVELHRCLRVGDWADRARIAGQFDRLSEIAAVVPVVRCRVPWDRQDRDAGHAVLDEVVRAAG